MPKLKYIGGDGAPENDVLFGFNVGKFGDVIEVDAEHPQWHIVSRHPWFQMVQDTPPPADHAPPTTTPPPDVTPPVEPEPPMDQQTIDALSEESIRLAEATLKANEGDENAFDIAELPADAPPAAVAPPPPEPIVEQPAPPTTRRRRAATPPEGSA